jgi:hypothetical protein
MKVNSPSEFISEKEELAALLEELANRLARASRTMKSYAKDEIIRLVNLGLIKMPASLEDLGCCNEALAQDLARAEIGIELANQARAKASQLRESAK